MKKIISLILILSFIGCSSTKNKDIGILVKQKAVCTYNDGKKAFFEYKKFSKNGWVVVEYETHDMTVNYNVGSQYIVVIGVK